jgi:glycosyltransferase involved in cell wall biosynthesis
MLSVAIIAKDEERYLAGAIESARAVADEVLVLLDDRTADASATIARESGARLVVEPWRGFSAQRNRALALCSHPWVLFLDADERITRELADELLEIRDWRLGMPASDSVSTRPATPDANPASSDPQSPNLQSPIVGYAIPRYNLFFGRRLRGGGWYPDPQLRLLRRDRARYDEARLVHEFPLLEGELGALRGHLLHHNIDALGEFWRKQSEFARKEADTLLAQGVRARPQTFLGAPARELWRRFVRLGGWRDGVLGLFLCGALALFELIKALRMWELGRVEVRD